MRTLVHAVLIFATALSGCAAVTPPVRLQNTFDLAEAQTMLRAGSNKVTGSALIRQQGGGIVTCAGAEVLLIPATAYASERMKFLYGNTEKGFRPLGTIRFEPDTPEYLANVRRVTCDSQGMFEFESVSDHVFYVATQVAWTVGYSPQGGALMQKVALTGRANDQNRSESLMGPNNVFQRRRPRVARLRSA